MTSLLPGSASGLSSRAAGASALAPTRPAGGTGRTVRRGGHLLPHPVAGLSFALLLVALATGRPALVLLAVVGLAASVLRRWWPADLALTLAVLGLLAGAVAVGLVAGRTGVDLLGHPTAVTAGWATAGIAALAASGRTSRRAHPGHRVAGPAWVFLPAWFAMATGVLQALSGSVAKSWAFHGTDLAQHMIMLAAVQRTGHLDYDVSGPYPRGVETLAMLVSVPDAPLAAPAALLAYDLGLYAALCWFALAAFLVAGASLTLRVGSALALPPRLCAVAALTLGLGALVTSSFVAGFVYLGAAASLLAVVTVWSLPLVLLVRRPVALPSVALLTCAQAMLLAHLWQALVVVPAVALLAVAAPGVRRLAGCPATRATLRAVLRAAPVALVLLAVAAVPLLAVLGAGGVGLAATTGTFGGAPWRILVPALLCLPWALHRAGGARSAWVRALLGAVAGLIGVWALMLHGSGSLDLNQWYPMKAAWFLTLVLAPVLALAATVATARAAAAVSTLLARTGRPAGVLRAGTLALVLATLFAFWLPHMIGPGSATADAWRADDRRDQHDGEGGRSRASAQRFDLASRYGTPADGRVAVPYFLGWSAMWDTDGTTMISALLTFQTGQGQLFHEPTNLCRAISRVAGRRPAVVVSKLSPRLVRADLASDGCAGRATVRHVPGHLGDVPFSRGLLARPT